MGTNILNNLESLPESKRTPAPLSILQISSLDIAGGAEKVAWNLFEGYIDRGHHSWLAVGSKRGNDPRVIDISSRRPSSLWRQWCRQLGKQLDRFEGRVPGLWRVAPFCENPPREIQRWLGIEDFNFPETRRILDLPPKRPDVVHCHNLHEAYFDLRQLPRISREVPTMLTLHDGWLLSGHCAHSVDCERWKTGCGRCPDLNSHPAIEHDATAYNWRRKQQIFGRSRFYVATPSEWLMRKVEQSILAPAVIEGRVIPNGVDTSIFHPGNQQAARTALDIPCNSRMVLFTANTIRTNVWKDYETLRRAVTIVAEQSNTQQIVLVALGERASTERVGNAELRFVPYQKNPETVATYYRAADIYIHAARADTFPSTVIEALACGIPVIATAVGGIPEQVKGLVMQHQRGPARDLNRYGPDQATGVLVPVGDAGAMADCIETVLADEPLRRLLGANAAYDAADRFNLARQIERYLGWYDQVARS